MRPSMTAPAVRRGPGTGLLYLITSGLLWGTGGLTGSLLSRVAGLSAMSVAACAPQQPGCDEVEQARAGPAARDRRHHG